MSEPLFLEERRRAILDLLQKQGRVSVKELSEQLQVSAVTIRQDLRALQEEGIVERTYGGAVLQDKSSPMAELSFNLRMDRNSAEKDALGRAAAALVQEGDGIALDASTTSYSVTQYLKAFRRLTVVSNSLMVTRQFLDSPNIEVMMPAGRLRRDSVSLVGEPNSLPELHLNLALFGTWGLSWEIGSSELSQETVTMKQAMIQYCREVVILADSTKWGKLAPYTCIPPEQITRILTTTLAPPAALKPFKAAGIRVDVIEV